MPYGDPLSGHQDPHDDLLQVGSLLLGISVGQDLFCFLSISPVHHTRGVHQDHIHLLIEEILLRRKESLLYLVLMFYKNVQCTVPLVDILHRLNPVEPFHPFMSSEFTPRLKQSVQHKRKRYLPGLEPQPSLLQVLLKTPGDPQLVPEPAEDYYEAVLLDPVTLHIPAQLYHPELLTELRQLLHQVGYHPARFFQPPQVRHCHLPYAPSHALCCNQKQVPPLGAVLVLVRLCPQVHGTSISTATKIPLPSTLTKLH